MLAEGVSFAGYRIERELGRGGMGAVYLARHPRLPRRTALKLLSPELFTDRELRARFEREADLAAQLDHPNIVTVFDRGSDEDQLWISMQYIDGVDASALHPDTLHPSRAAQIIAETGAALDYAHRMGVLHRDVKPANILLSRAEGQERIYLTDFGIARLRDDTGHLTQTGTFTATLAYAAPEQLTGVPLDHRADQYSLACTLFTLLTGAAPFEGAGPAAVIQGHLQQPAPPISSRRAGLPAALDPVVAKALAKRPAERYDSCAEFADAVRAVLVAAERPPTPATPYPSAGPGVNYGHSVPHPQVSAPQYARHAGAAPYAAPVAPNPYGGPASRPHPVAPGPAAAQRVPAAQPYVAPARPGPYAARPGYPPTAPRDAGMPAMRPVRPPHRPAGSGATPLLVAFGIVFGLAALLVLLAVLANLG
ncbi:protein kinase domain-containing protein [Nocardia thailandica]